jgi:acetolactate synthase-1/2/3 large subunit
MNENLHHESVAERAARALKRHGVEVIFAQSLPTKLILAAEDIGIRQFVYRTENAGGAMADAYARCTNKVGVCAAQNGPAATLLGPPLAEALKASIPILALVQDVNRPEVDRNAFQELDHIALFGGCSKWVRRIDRADRIDDYIDMAFVAAATGRPGPAVLLIPADLLLEDAPEPPHPRSRVYGNWPLDRVSPDPKSVAAAASLIANARRPIVIAGGGVHSAQAYDELERLQQVAAIPVAYTTMGKGAVVDGNPLTLGLTGNLGGHRSTAKFMKPILDEADTLILVGTRTNQNGTDSWTTLPETATVIHIDVDGQEVGRTYEADVRMVGDARLALNALNKALASHDLSARRSARAELEARIAAAHAARNNEIKDVWNSDQSPLRPERIMRELQNAIPDDTTVVADASYSSIWIASYLEARQSGRYHVAPRGLAGLGWGYPMAIGAQVARPNHRVVAVVGDGGFGHCWAELETAKRMKVPVMVVVLNNSLLGYQKDAELVKFGRYTSAIHFGEVDHAQLAKAVGVKARRVETIEELQTALQDALIADEPWLLDVITDPDAYPPVKQFDQLQ